MTVNAMTTDMRANTPYTPPPGHYDGAELRTYTGRPDANQHMDHGRVENGTWTPYTRPGLVRTGSPTKPTPTATASGNSTRKSQPSPLYGSTFCSKTERPSLGKAVAA